MIKESHTFILTPRKRNGTNEPIVMERGTLEICERVDGTEMAVITNRCGDRLTLDMDGFAALASLMHDMVAQGRVK